MPIFLKICLFSVLLTPVFAQFETSYQPETTKNNDLLHTELHLKPNWQKKQIAGSATLRLKPHFYDQKSVILDAKGFEIQGVIGQKGDTLKYTYDGFHLNINLGRTYTRKDTFSVAINYVAKPYEAAFESSSKSTEHGLYFIFDSNKPLHFWSQGETQGNSFWFPTMDTPNQKHTQDIFLTVDNQYVTLSNGKLLTSIINADSTRTDHWQQLKPHAPYLTMIAGGLFDVQKEKAANNIELSYYVEPNYAPFSKAIFGRTAEMMAFFEQKLGVPYAWDKYAQMVVRDFKAGAMENTTATIHAENTLRDLNDLVDKNEDNTIAHELFHHWFGDLVTAESWSNLPLNESFANYSEYLWMEHKYGRAEADFHHQEELEGYLSESNEKQENLVRYHYADREDMFDAHSYNKGGRVLHMLRKYVGDEAFFEALKLYLTQNKFKAAEIHDLRKAFETVVGEDLNWFFDQWFLAKGHPILGVKEYYKDGKLTITLEQQQNLEQTPTYKLPLKIGVWTEDGKYNFDAILQDAIQIFTFDVSKKPLLVLVDEDTQLLGEILHQKSVEALKFQFLNAPNVLSRMVAFDSLAAVYAYKPDVLALLTAAKEDVCWQIREKAIGFQETIKAENPLETVATVLKLVRYDAKPAVRAAAIKLLRNLGTSTVHTPVYLKALADTSYAVRAAALQSLIDTQNEVADSLVKSLKNTNSSAIQLVLAEYFSKPTHPDFDWFVAKIPSQNASVLYESLQLFGALLLREKADKQVIGLQILENHARNHPQIYVRFGAFQTLQPFSGDRKIEKIIKDIVAKETDPMLLKVYRRFD